ncbi:hypothetical protein evm_008952 [Chilo suppressalis]|nr:hypothetical protein evm_008952 [Chilo suppressalis]
MAQSPYSIHREGICPSSGDINRLMMMMMIGHGAYEQMAHLMVSDHRRPWTLATPGVSQMRCHAILSIGEQNCNGSKANKKGNPFVATNTAASETKNFIFHLALLYMVHTEITVHWTNTRVTEATSQPIGKIETKDNRLQSLFQPDSELALNHKNALLTEEAKRSNLITEIMHPSLIEVTRQSQNQHSDSEDSEVMDVLGVVGLPREVAKLRLRPTRSSSILHSVEDLSTDSTCVYKASRRKISRSLYIRPPLPSRLIQSKLAEPVIVKQEQEVQKEEEVEEKEEKRGCVAKISRYLDVSLLRSRRFGLLCASVALMSCGSPYALYYLPAHAVKAGHSKGAAGHLVAISAVLDLCGRLGLGWLCDLHLFCRKKAYILSILVAGIAVLTLPSLTSWWALAVASGAYGLCLGCWFLLVPVLLADAFGTARIASSYGLVRMFQSIAAVSVPPTAGLVRDVTGGYSWCFYGMGSCMVLGTIPVIAFYFLTKNDDTESNVD